MLAGYIYMLRLRGRQHLYIYMLEEESWYKIYIYRKGAYVVRPRLLLSAPLKAVSGMPLWRGMASRPMALSKGIWRLIFCSVQAGVTFTIIAVITFGTAPSWRRYGMALVVTRYWRCYVIG